MSCVVNDIKEQRNRDSRLEGYVFDDGKIYPNAKVKRGDIFYTRRVGNLSDGWIYYVEVIDELNNKKYILSYQYKSFEWIILSFETIDLSDD